jgi:hypothetical protein
MVTGLSMMAKLKKFVLEFKLLQSHLGQKSRRPPPPTRTLLPLSHLLWVLWGQRILGGFRGLG